MTDRKERKSTSAKSASTSRAGPIQAADLKELFARLQDYETVFLAVSGGSDSIALMHLVNEWRSSTDNPPCLHVLTVNHGLRPEAQSEAQAVVAAANELGIPADMLTHHGPRPNTGVQAAARELRYNLLFQHISQRADIRLPTALLTAHHRDDLAETVLMRLARGAGTDGLAAIPSVTVRGDIHLIRPLLNIPKARLVETLQALGVQWHEDPSNQNQAYERVRLRQIATARENMQLSDAALALTAGRMARAKDALEQMAEATLRPALAQPLLQSAGVFNWEWKSGDLHDEIAIRILMRLLPLLGGSNEPVRLMRVEKLLQAMKLADFPGATLANCIVRPSGGSGRLIYREPKRGELPRIAVRDQAKVGQNILWDQRFQISGLAPCESAWEVRAFVRDDLESFDVWRCNPELPCTLDALEATPVLADADGAFWFPALDMHRSAKLLQRHPQLMCRFRIPSRIFDTRPGPIVSDCDKS